MKRTILSSHIARAMMAAAACLLLASQTAQAKIRCDGAYQVIKGQGHIATPYCGDNYLGQVARGYGIRVSNREIRQNPNRKAEICKHIGHDTRVQDICTGFRDNDSGHGYR